MRNIVKLGLAAALLMGTAGATVAQDTEINANAGAGVDAGVSAGTSTGGNTDTGASTSGNMNAGANVGANVDAGTTGSIGDDDRNYGSLISSLQTDAQVDLSSWRMGTNVNCVAVSDLQGNASGNAQALANALEKNQDGVDSLQASIGAEANAQLMEELKTACSAEIEDWDFNVEDVIAVRTGADGSFTFYVDDRA